MKSNVHSKTIDQATLEAIVKLLVASHKALGDYVTPLTPKDRRSMLKMGERTMAFVDKCHEFAKNNPGICPKYFDMDAFSTDYHGAHDLFNVVNMAAQLWTNLVDTQMRAGSEAYQSALVFYNAAKTAANNNVPGAKAIYEELSKRFPSGRRRRYPVESAVSQEVNQAL